MDNFQVQNVRIFYYEIANPTFKTIIQIPDWCKETVRNGKAKIINLKCDKKSKQFIACITFKLEDKIEPKIEGNVVGIDRGLKNIVVTSNNEFFNANKIGWNISSTIKQSIFFLTSLHLL